MIDKWKAIIDSIGLTGSQKDWMSEYAELHSSNEIKPIEDVKLNSYAILPIAMRVAAKTLGSELVSVQPMSSPTFGNSKEELEKIKGDVKSTNRDSKIESIIEDKEYKEMEIKDHPDYKSGLFYMDYVYGSTSSQSKK
jgi:hypothetical protein